MGVNSSRQQYIEQYAGYAMEQMRRYGIPASVTLAQGIIESASGKSTLAQTANNHFGVKVLIMATMYWLTMIDLTKNSRNMIMSVKVMKTILRF